MVQALIKLDENTNRVLNIVKAKYSLKDKAEAIRLVVKRYVEEENFELADDVISEVEESRKRHKKEFISHEEMRKEFG